MRKNLLVIACAFCALTASAQRASSSSSSFFSTEKSDEGITFGIRAGLNMSNMTFSDDEVSVSPDSRTSFHVGVTADIPLMQSLYVQTGLFFQNKGYKLDYDGDTETAKPMYFEIPVLASYRYDLSDAMQLQVNFGPYFGYGIGGKIKLESDYDDENYEFDFFGDKEDDGYKSFNCGLQVGAGLTFNNHLYLGFSYQFGLSNISNDSDFSVKDKNCMISLGYNF